jgi:hypothetical protein
MLPYVGWRLQIAGACCAFAAGLQIATPLQKEGSNKWFTELSLPVSDRAAVSLHVAALCLFVSSWQVLPALLTSCHAPAHGLPASPCTPSNHEWLRCC